MLRFRLDLSALASRFRCGRSRRAISEFPPLIETDMPTDLHPPVAAEDADPRQAQLARYGRLLEEMVRLHTENAALVADLTVHLTAARRLGYALVASHPDPRALANEFHHQMDLVADDISPARVDAYRDAMQGVNAAIMDAVNRRDSGA